MRDGSRWISCLISLPVICISALVGMELERPVENLILPQTYQFLNSISDNTLFLPSQEVFEIVKSKSDHLPRSFPFFLNNLRVLEFYEKTLMFWGRVGVYLLDIKVKMRRKCEAKYTNMSTTNSPPDGVRPTGAVALVITGHLLQEPIHTIVKR